MDVVNALVTFLSGNVDINSFTEFLQGTLKADFTAWSLKVAIVWALMGSKVNNRFKEFEERMSQHFEKIEKAFENLVDKMAQLNDRVEKLETKN